MVSFFVVQLLQGWWSQTSTLLLTYQPSKSDSRYKNNIGAAMFTQSNEQPFDKRNRIQFAEMACKKYYRHIVKYKDQKQAYVKRYGFDDLYGYYKREGVANLYSRLPQAVRKTPDYVVQIATSKHDTKQFLVEAKGCSPYLKISDYEAYKKWEQFLKDDDVEIMFFLYSGLRKNVAKVISLRQITNIINSNVLKKDKYHDNGEDRWTIPWNLIDSEEIEIFTPEEIAKFERIGALYKKLENEKQPQLSM